MTAFRTQNLPKQRPIETWVTIIEDENIKIEIGVRTFESPFGKPLLYTRGLRWKCANAAGIGWYPALTHAIECETKINSLLRKYKKELFAKLRPTGLLNTKEENT